MHKPGTFFLLVLFTVALQGLTFAQDNGTIEGTIIEAGTNEPLFGANAMVVGTVRGASTDLNGRFVIRGVEAGTQTIRISYLGYKTTEKIIEVKSGEITEVSVVLEWGGVVGEEITVTVQAQGQISAINEQRASNTISNIVSGDRIKELPDVSAAESIGRLPGISVQRSGGEANKIVVRGLSPKYNNVTVNGVKMPSTDTNNRSVDLSLVSSNMLDGIEVTKALTPDQDADAHGGTVNLRLRNAPENISTDISMQGGYTALQEAYGNYKFAGSVSNRFLDNKLGIILNLNTDRYDRSADNFNGSYGDKLVDDERIPIPTGLNLNENALDRSRLGGSVVLDYKIANGSIVYNTIYNQLTNDGFTRGNNMNYGGRIHTYSLNDNFNETFVWANGLRLEQDFGWIEYDAGVSLTSSASESPEDFYWEFREESAAFQTTEEDTLQPSDLPSLFRNDIDNTYLFFLQQSSRETNEDEYTVQANFKFPFSINRIINGYFKTGAKYRNLSRFNDQTSLGTGAFYGGDQTLRVAIAEAFPELNLDGRNRLPLSPFQSDYSRSNFIDGNYSLGYTINPDMMRKVTDVAREGEFMSYSRSGSLGNDYEGDEEFTAFYAMSEIKIGNKVTLMPGFRFEKEHTDYSAKYSTGLEPPSGVPLEEISFSDTTSIRSDQFWLPMVHLQVDPVDWVKFRFAYTESISRPDFRQFAPITYFNFISAFANAPNRNLRSSKSQNFDASVSLFQNKIGFFTASAFYKEIEDLIWGVSFVNVPGQTIIPDLEIKEAGNNIITIYSDINNPNPAYIKGIELDWQTNFWYLPSFLKGLVLNANYTHIVSETEVPAFELQNVPITPRPRRPPFTEPVLKDTTISQTLPDQPSDILNLTVGYDYKGFSTRVSFFYQLGSILGRGNNPFSTWDDTYKDDFFRIDVSLNQRLPYNFQVYANLNNLNSEGDRQYQSPRFQYPTNEQYYGFTMDVGVRYKF